MNTARQRGRQGTTLRSGSELQAEKRTALAAVDTDANGRQLHALGNETLELRELAFVLKDAQSRFTQLRRRLRSKVYPIPEYAEFANHVLDLFAAVAEIPVSRALGACFSGLRGLEKIELDRGIPNSETVFERGKEKERNKVDALVSDALATERRVAPEVYEEAYDLQAKLDGLLRSTKQKFEEDDEAGLVGQPVGPTPREVERALYSVQIATEQQEVL